LSDDTLLRLQQQSVVMERFGPLPGAPVDECERLAASSDLVVCILAHRYGYEPDAGHGSITRREVEAAKRAGKPVYAWIVEDKHPWTEAKEQERLTQPDVLADPAKASEVLAAIKGLQDFKAWLRRDVATESFTTADDLGRKIAMTLANVPRPAAAGHSSSSALSQPELRIVHALQPAPHFNGRDALVETLSKKWRYETPGWEALLARAAIAEGQDPRSHIDEVRAWTARWGHGMGP
jgi:hypothetical protein